MQFSDNSVDLLKTAERYTKKYGAPRVSRKSFGLPIVMMAHATIGRTGTPVEELPGIRKCLIHVTGQIDWRNYIWVLPLPYKQVPFHCGVFGGHLMQDKLSLLVDSLILTMLSYQQSLWEFETNLGNV